MFQEQPDSCEGNAVTNKFDPLVLVSGSFDNLRIFHE